MRVSAWCSETSGVATRFCAPFEVLAAGLGDYGRRR